MSEKKEFSHRSRFIWRDDDSYFVRPKIEYDDIVDDTDFKALKSESRLTRLNQEGAGQGQGLYDFDGTEKDMPFDKVTDEIVALRSGILDKADIDTIQRDSIEKSRKAVSDAEKKKAEKNAEKVSRERQEFIDSRLGFKPSSQDGNA